ncbi:MAG TPA: hypothetical protein VI976_00685, partial [Candidatus Omnitrophota bacterium]|nr:hypothetical protein [Candidatus Omnitrophota bacterium]
MRRRPFNLPIRLVSACLIIILGISLAFVYSFKLLKGLDYFRIKEITIKEQDLPNQDIKTNDFSSLKGKSMFDINLNYAAGVFLEAYPNYSRVRLIRVFPDRLFVYFLKRKPIALVKLYKYFGLDEEGALFSLNTA